MTDKLGVYLHGEFVGEIHRLTNGRIFFEIDESYRRDPNRFTLSQSFIQQDGNGDVIHNEPATTAGQVPHFFSNLLPEGALRAYIAKQADVSEHREFELLALLGSDLPGAVEVIQIQGGARADEISQPDLNDTASETLYFSLAGVQLKFSAINDRRRGLTIPAHGLGGDWILKLPSPHYARVPENEYAVMSMAARVGINVPELRLTPLAEVGGLPPEVADLKESEALALKRFDRTENRRIHMEDFAQAMGQRPYDKYKPIVNYIDVARMIALVCREHDVMDFSRRLMFNAIVGNGDMHLKNWSFLYPDGRTPELSPAYDFLCTTKYIPHDRMALKLGSTNKWQELTLDDFAAVADGAGVDQQSFVDAAVDTVDQFHNCWEDSAKSLPIDNQLKGCIERQMMTCPAIKSALRQTPSRESRTLDFSKG